MKRNLKALGLALVAVFAMSVVAASGASAASFTSTTSPTTFTGAQSETNIFTADAGEVECDIANFSGTATGTSVSSVTVTPEYDDCLGFGLEANVEMNSCQYVLHANGEADVECAGSDVIEVIAAFGLCTVTVPEQTGLGDVGYTHGVSDGKTDITVDITISGITYEEHGAFCADETVLKHNGTLTGKVTVKGEDSSGNPVDITHHS